MIGNLPPFLFHRGALHPRDARSIAVVGTRRAASDGLRLAARTAREFVEHDVVIASGLADRSCGRSSSSARAATRRSRQRRRRPCDRGGGADDGCLRRRAGARRPVSRHHPLPAGSPVRLRHLVGYLGSAAAAACALGHFRDDGAGVPTTSRGPQPCWSALVFTNDSQLNALRLRDTGAADVRGLVLARVRWRG
ncbi:DNA-processing protein DprA [Streptomyces sulphureus]|uniref:DNA-processing protein DprA n=1 Tax=Streptomyces sulphureus TaxID=47758 RepID=UPI001FE0E8AD|nr:DNA-processing protein DprA [Streptomyces sulphureus]